MDIKLLLSKHLAWKSKFIHAVYSGEPLDCTNIEKDDCCDAGKWMHGEGKANYGHFPSYETCVNKHAEFHIEAAKMCFSIKEKQFTEAKKLLSLDSSFSQAALGLWTALKQLEQEMLLERDDIENRDQFIPDDFYAEFECLTNLIQEVDDSQNFYNSRELLTDIFKDS